jgi:tyrosine-protein kinase Etk/Wzc
MDASKSNINGNPFADVSLQFILKKIFRRKWLFALSLGICLSLAYLYTKVATPVYQCATTILIHAETPTTILNPSKEFEFSQKKEEKNLNNEIALITTHSMIKKSLEPLDFTVNYYSGTWYGKKEKYGYFPFVVELVDSSAQLYGAFFEVVQKSETEYELILNEETLVVSDPITKATHDVEQPFQYKETHKFGEAVKTDFFNFIIKKPETKVSQAAFAGMQLFFKLKTLDGLANAFKGDLDVEQPDLGASVLRLQTQGPIPKKQLLFLEELSKNYILSKEESRRSFANNKKAVIERALAETNAAMRNAEINLQNFQNTSGRINIPMQATASMEKIDVLETEKNQFELNVDIFNQILISLKQGENIQDVPAIVGIDDPLLNENLVQLQNLYGQLTEKSKYYGPASKDLALIKDQIKNTTEQIKTSLVNLIGKSQLESQNRARRIAELQQSVTVLPAEEQISLNLQRSYDLAVKKYEFLSNELSKTQIAEIEKIIDAEVLEAPRKKGDEPIAPKKPLIMLLGAMAGLLFPFLFIIFFDPYDEDLTEAVQVEKYSNLPVIGSVAHFSEKKSIFGGPDSRWQVEESFRDVCTNVQILLPDSNHNVIGISSTVPNEGKTFCALNMAINLAASGKKVLLIDSDLRNSDLMVNIGIDKNKKLDEKVILANGTTNDAREGKEIVTQGGSWFEYHGHPVKVKGLYNYLSGEETDVKKIIHSYKEEPNLKFIPASHMAEDENPHRLLTDKRFELLIKDARREFDFVVIDSPPVGLVSDYLLISKFIDLHLMIVRRNVSKFSYLQGLEKIKRTAKLKNVLVVFNDAAGKSMKYGYSGYSYGKKAKK